MLDAIVERIPRARGRPGRARARAHLRLHVRPVPGRGRVRARHRRRLLAARAAASDGAGHDVRGRGARRRSRPSRGPRRALCRRRGRLRRHRPQGREDCRVGDTLTTTSARPPSRCPATGRPSRWSSRASTRRRPTSIRTLRDALDKLKLNDASLFYEPETSQALGFGFRCGFLGLLHMEIVQERLEREYDLDLLVDGAERRVPGTTKDGQEIDVDNPSDLPPPRSIGDRRAVHRSVDHRPRTLHRRRHGAVTRTRRRAEFHHMEYLQRGPRHARVRPPARRDRLSTSTTS